MPFPISIVSNTKDATDWIVVGAAVVQAVGSILAILGAAWITNHDRKESNREIVSRSVSALAAIIFRAEDTIRKPYDRLSADGGRAYSEIFGRAYGKNIRTLEQCLKILRAIPTHELGNWELVSAVLDMEEALVTGRTALDKVKKESKAALFYPDTANINLEAMIAPVNLAAEAVRRIHQLAHSNSQDPRARRYRIKPSFVADDNDDI